jgi:hypothetical protein
VRTNVAIITYEQNVFQRYLCDQVARLHCGAKLEPQSANDLRGNRPRCPEANAVGPKEAKAPVAHGRAEIPRTIVPGTPASNTCATISTCRSRTVRRRSRIVVLVAVLYPFPHIAVHVVQAKSVGQKPDTEIRKTSAMGTISSQSCRSRHLRMTTIYCHPVWVQQRPLSAAKFPSRVR